MGMDMTKMAAAKSREDECKRLSRCYGRQSYEQTRREVWRQFYVGALSTTPAHWTDTAANRAAIMADHALDAYETRLMSGELRTTVDIETEQAAVRAAGDGV